MCPFVEYKVSQSLALPGVCGALHEGMQKVRSLTYPRAQDPLTTAISPSSSLRTRVILGHPAAQEGKYRQECRALAGHSTVLQTGVRNKGTT